MQVESLFLKDFRCIETSDLSFTSGVNCIVGDNASGKTTLLEAIYVLGRGESFRQTQLNKAIRSSTDAFTLRTRIQQDSGARHRIGAHVTKKNAQLKLDEQSHTTRYDLISTLPLQHIDPNVHRLLEQGPKYRRHFLDWGVFHVEHAFFPAWRRFRKALRQRNRALKSRQPKHLVVAWDSELVEQGEIIDACRRRYLEHIKRYLPQKARHLVGDDSLCFDYLTGWRGQHGLGPALAQGLEQDIKAGFTQQGPHRADLQISIATRRAKDWVSRGQQKLLTAALLLAQADILYTARGLQPILLLDDMAAELGVSYRDALATEISRIGAQCFLTFLNPESIPDAFSDARMFHVERGEVTTL